MRQPTSAEIRARPLPASVFLTTFFRFQMEGGTMNVHVLGCSGGAFSINGEERRTTAYLIGPAILVDAGSGVFTLSSDDICRLTDVFVSHAHLDHVMGLPLLADARMLAAGEASLPPLTVHALPETIDALRNHLFNNVIFPDFSTIPSKEAPMIVFSPLAPEKPVVLNDLRVTPYSVDHVVPAVAYVVDGSDGAVFFSGDTASTDAIARAVANHPGLSHLIVELTFTDDMLRLALDSKHFCPKLLVETLESADFSKCYKAPKLWTTHAKPELEAALRSALVRYARQSEAFARLSPAMLSQDMTLSLGSSSPDSRHAPSPFFRSQVS